MAQVQGDDKPISDAELRDAVKAAHDRGAHRIEIEALERQRLPKGTRSIADMPPAARPGFLGDLALLQPPEFAPIAQRLAKVAEGAGGQFVVMAFGDASVGPDERQALLYVPNQGAPAAVAGGLLEAALELAHKTRRDGSPRHWNVYVAPVLMREGLASGQRGGDKDVIAVLAAVMDFDDGKPYADRLPMEPHAVVETSPGTGNAQCWWFFDRPVPPADAAPLIAGLTRGCGADPSGKPVSHPFRVPGLMNWPNAKKVLAGRKPVRSRLASFIDGEGLPIEGLRAAVLAKFGEAAFLEPAKGTGDGEGVAWDKPLREPARPMPEPELRAILNSPEHAGDRSEGCWHVVNELLRRGYTPNDVVGLLSGRADTVLGRHYSDHPTGPEAAIRADVTRAVQEGDWQSFKGIDLLHDNLTQYTIEDVLLAFNRDYAAVRHGKTLIYETGWLETPAQGIGEFHAFLQHRKIRVPVAGGETKLMPASKAWMQWDNRRSYQHGLVFKPGQPKDKPGDWLNLWDGWEFEPKPGNCSLYKAHLREIMCGGVTEYYDHLWKSFAWWLQNPDQPGQILIAARGEEGSGKGVVFRVYGSLYGKWFQPITNIQHITGRFNTATRAQVLFLDEAWWPGDKAAEGPLKALITEPTLMMEGKFEHPVRIDNCTRLVVSTNNAISVPAAIGARRFYCLRMKDTYSYARIQQGTEAEKQHAEAYWDAFYHGRKDTNDVPVAVKQALMWDLLHTDLTSFNIRDFPVTDELIDQIDKNLHGVQKWWREILWEGEITFGHWQPAVTHRIEPGLTLVIGDLYDHYDRWRQRHKEWNLIERSQFCKALRRMTQGQLLDYRPAGSDRSRRYKVTADLGELRRAFNSSLSREFFWPGPEAEDDDPLLRELMGEAAE